MTSFKVGDRVRVLRADYSARGLQVGDVAEIVGRDGACYRLGCAAHPYGLNFFDTEIELIPGAPALVPMTDEAGRLEKPGSIFVIATSDDAEGWEVGKEVELVEQDGTRWPGFRRVEGDSYVRYLFWKNLSRKPAPAAPKLVPMTADEGKREKVDGTVFVVVEEDGRAEPGLEVKLDRQDGSIDPYFVEIGKPVKDVDVFVGPDYDPLVFSKLAPAAWGIGEFNDSAWQVQYDHFFGSALKGIYSISLTRCAETKGDCPFCVCEAGVPVQVISMTSPLTYRQHLDRFDLDFCRFALTPDGVLHRDPVVQEGTASYVGDRHNAERVASSKKRAERLSLKYPEWRFCYPGEFLKNGWGWEDTDPRARDQGIPPL